MGLACCIFLSNRERGGIMRFCEQGKALLRTCAVVVFTAVFGVSLAACAGGKARAVDIGWAAFEMPDGYVQVSDLPDHAMISTSADTDPKNFILEERTIQIAPKVRESAWPDARSGMTRQVDKYPDKYADIEEMTIGNRQWYISAYTFREENDSVSGCADITDSRCVVFTAYYMTISDPDLQKVLETLRIDDSKLP